MIDSPYETQSDSFYFVNGKLIMHNKASYKVPLFTVLVSLCMLKCDLLLLHAQYFREDTAQAKKSYEDKFGSKVIF